MKFVPTLAMLAMVFLLVVAEGDAIHWRNYSAATRSICLAARTDRPSPSGRDCEPKQNLPWVPHLSLNEILLIIVGGAQVVLLSEQAGIADRQRRLMKRQLKTYNRQRKLMKGQLEAAKTAANAAQTAANAALVGLARPWLFVGNLTHNSRDWADGIHALVAQFQITNYGKAPAVIIAMDMVFFLAKDPRDVGEFTFDIPPENFHPFPGPLDLPTFIERYGKEPYVEDAVDPLRPTSLEDNRTLVHKVKIHLGIVFNDTATTEKFFVTGYEKIAKLGDAIPFQTAAGQFFVGLILYRVPGQESEALSFCYRANRRGGFDELFGPPYNERRKIPNSQDA